ncbi:MAG: hypothetical protein ABIF10_00995 [Candidatus Woesearchaeota archaeon]
MKKLFAFMIFLLFTQSVLATTVNVDDTTGADPNTYKGTLDYSASTVTFTFDDVQATTLSGTITASGMKENFTYQVKIMGKPTCLYAAGNDAANEYLGYKGRWTCANCAGTALNKNRNDAQYEACKTDPSCTECIQGYLVSDFFTTDQNGEATKSILFDSSYHVLFCNNGVCGSTSNTYLVNGLCAAEDVEGQIERGSCGTLTLNPGTYDVVLGLTEESFHQGEWANVLSKDMTFEIEGDEVCENILDELDLGGDESGHTISGWSNNQDGIPGWTGSNYGNGEEQTFRLMLGPGDGCADENRMASFTMEAGNSIATGLELKHLDGSLPDSFDLYYKDGNDYTKVGNFPGQGGSENWVESFFDISSYSLTGEIEFMVNYTSNLSAQWCPTYGQGAVSWAKLYGSCEQEIPEFTTIAMMLALIGAAGCLMLFRK